MSHASVSPLRQRLIDDMTIRHFARRTQQADIRATLMWTRKVALLSRSRYLEMEWIV